LSNWSLKGNSVLLNTQKTSIFLPQQTATSSSICTRSIHVVRIMHAWTTRKMILTNDSSWRGNYTWQGGWYDYRDKCSASYLNYPPPLFLRSWLTVKEGSMRCNASPKTYVTRSAYQWIRIAKRLGLQNKDINLTT